MNEPKTVTPWNPTEEEMKMVQFVRDRFEAMDQAKKHLSLEEKWNTAEAQVNDTIATRSSGLNIKNPSKVKNSLTRSAVYMTLALAVARNSQVELTAQDEKDRRLIPVFSKLLEFVNEKSKKEIKEIQNLLGTIQYGTGIKKHFYRADIRKVKNIESYDPVTETVKFKETEETKYNDIDQKDIDIRMFYIDDRATCMEDARDCIERRIIPYTSLEDEFPKSRYPKIEHVSPGGWLEGEDDDKRADKVFANDVDSDQLEAIEYYNEPKDLRLIFLNGVLITDADNPNPHWHKELPYSRSIFMLRDGQHFWGIGLPELVEHDQALLDTLYNMLVDWMKLLINKPALRGGGEDQFIDDQFTIEAGQIIDVNDVNNYKFFDIPGIDRSFFEGLEKIERNAYKKIGIDDPMYGVKSGGTATENIVSAQSAKDRLGLFFAMLELDTDIRDALLQISLIQQFYSQPERTEKLLGEDGEEVIQEHFRSLPVNLKKTNGEFGDEEYEDAKGEYFEVKPEDVGVYEDGMARFIVSVKSRGQIPISKEIAKKQIMERALTLSKVPAFAEMTNWEKELDDFNEAWGKDGDAYKMIEKSAEEELMELAEKENDRMMKGEPIPPTRGATMEHTARHAALADSQEFQQLDPQAQEPIRAHMEGEVAEHERNQGQGDMDIIRQSKQGGMQNGQQPMDQAPQGQNNSPIPQR